MLKVIGEDMALKRKSVRICIDLPASLNLEECMARFTMDSSGSQINHVSRFNGAR